MGFERMVSTSASSTDEATVVPRRSITELELTFAQDPASSVYVELCEAYLERSRFMEAMVVCKKAIRHSPEAVEPRLMLCRVYVAQRKFPRAKSEVDELYRAHPNSAEVACFHGQLLCALDETEQGIEELKRALTLDPNHEEALEALRELGVPLAPAAADAPAPSLNAPAMPDGSPTLHDGMSGAGGLAGTPPTFLPAEGEGGVSYESAHEAGVTGWSAETPPPDGMFEPAAAPNMYGQPGASFNAETARRREGVYAHSTVVEPADQSGIYRVRPQRLEGEDELEALAQRVAEEKPNLGRPKWTIAVAVLLVLVGAAILTQRVLHGRRVQAIAALSEQAVVAFDRDLYGSYQKSAEYLERILEEHDPEHALTNARLAHVYAILLSEHLEQSVAQRFEAVLLRAEQLAPDNQHTLSAQALAALSKRKPEQAAALLKPYLSDGAQETVVPTYIDLTQGIVELEIGAVETAMGRLRQVAKLLGNNVRARMWYARSAASAERLSTAYGAFMHVQNAEPTHPGALAGMGLVAIARGHIPGAQRAVNAFDNLRSAGSRDISPRESALIELTRSELTRAGGQEAEANLAYDAAVRLDPENGDLPFVRGRSALRSDRVDEAVKYVGLAVQAEPTRWTFHVEMAEALMAARKFKLAKTHIETALKLAPERIEVQLAKARLQRRTGSKTAEAFLKDELQAQFPQAKALVALELGRLYRSQKRLEEAEEQLSVAMKASANLPTHLQADVLVSYGLVLQSLRRTAEAETAYRAAVKRENLDALALLAALLANGNRAEQREALRLGRSYLEAGASLRRTKFVQGVVARLEGE